MTPWNIYSSPVAVNYFLGGLGAFLGPLFGIIVVDYYLVKRGRVDIDGLYQTGEASPYWYEGGINRHAVWVFVIAAAVAAIIALLPAFRHDRPLLVVRRGRALRKPLLGDRAQGRACPACWRDFWIGAEARWREQGGTGFGRPSRHFPPVVADSYTPTTMP